jgi:methionyl-tRNA synthetase
MTNNQIDNYNALQKQDTENRKLIKKLQLDKQALKQQLSLYGVSHRRELLFALVKHINTYLDSEKGFKIGIVDEFMANNCG